MDFIGWTSSEESEDHEVGRKSDATVFWDTRSIIHIDYLPSKQTINGDYYVALLYRFNNILKKTRPHLAKKKVLFHQNNARARHTCSAPMAKFNEFRYELLSHSAYSPDLVPCDYFLFPNLKKWFGGKRFTTREHHRLNRLFWRVGQIILFGRLEKVVESLDQVYRAERRL